MIKRLVEWVKTHKLTTALIAVVGFFVFQWFVNSGIYYNLNYQGAGRGEADYYGGFSAGMAVPSATSYSKSATYESGSPSTTYDSVQNPQGLAVEVKNRMVSKNYSISAVGKNIQETAGKITSEVENLGGFVVNNSVKEYLETESAYITARVPASKSKEFVDMIKSSVQKVVTQDENSSDITDAYTDTQENLRLLQETKVRFEEIWKSSTKTQDMLSVLREIQNIQREIDSLKGQEKYYEELAKYSYFNISLSKDEMDLPYMPDESWSAEYVFKSAVRDLVRVFRGFATKAIWLVVFAVIWLPILLIALLVFKKFKKQIVG